MATSIRLCALPLVSPQKEPLEIVSSKRSREVKVVMLGFHPNLPR